MGSGLWLSSLASSSVRSVVVNFHLNGCAVWLYRFSNADRRSDMASISVKSLGESTFRWTIGEVDLYLVQPGRVHRGVHHDRVGVLLGESVDRGLSAMGGPVVHDPEHPIG